jgi:shikimate kinase
VTAAVSQPDRQPPQGAVGVVGFMGAGKSAVGRALARALGLPFVDGDDLIVASEGPIAGIFALKGEAAFRAVERDVTVAAAAFALEEPVVLALGGGAVLDDAVRVALRRLPHVVWLTAPASVLWARVCAAGLGDRPLARDEAEFGRLLDARLPLYREVATLVVENDGSRSLQALAAEIVGTLGRARAAARDGTAGVVGAP